MLLSKHALLDNTDNTSNNSNINNFSMKIINPPTRVISVVNQKGGVGKTTTTINVAAALSGLGKKVLLVDMDPQSNLSQSLGIQTEALKTTVYDLLREVESFESVVFKHKKFDVIPASLGLSGAELELAGVAGREFLLKRALTQVIEEGIYDYILIDCSPSLGILTLNSLVASKEVFIPVQTQFLSMQGLSQLLRTIEIVKDRLNQDIEITGVILTMYDSRTNLSNEVCEKVIEHFDKLVFKTRIPVSVALAEAPSYGKDIFDYKIASEGANNYLALTKEIIKQEKRKEKNDSKN